MNDPTPQGLYQCPCCHGPSDGPGWCRDCLAHGFMVTDPHGRDDDETAGTR